MRVSEQEFDIIGENPDMWRGRIVRVRETQQIHAIRRSIALAKMSGLDFSVFSMLTCHKHQSGYCVKVPTSYDRNGRSRLYYHCLFDISYTLRINTGYVPAKISESRSERVRALHPGLVPGGLPFTDKHGFNVVLAEKRRAMRELKLARKVRERKLFYKDADEIDQEEQKDIQKSN
jgi:hypothetical protein